MPRSVITSPPSSGRRSTVQSQKADAATGRRDLTDQHQALSSNRLAREVWDYERYAGHRVWEGARGTIGGTYPFWHRHRYTRSETFPRLHVVLAGKTEHLLGNRLKALAADVQGIAVAVWVNTLPRLKRGEP